MLSKRIFSLLLSCIIMAVCFASVRPSARDALPAFLMTAVPSEEIPPSISAAAESPVSSPSPSNSFFRMINSEIKEVPVYKFDLNDKDSLRNSSGTGGTKWLYTEKADYESCFGKMLDDLIHVRGISFDDNSIYAEGLSGFEDEINDFLEQSRNTLAADSDYWTDGTCLGIEIYENLHFVGDIACLNVHSYCEYNKTGKSLFAVFDLNKKKRLALSDLFCDGYNYIDHINKEISDTINIYDIYYPLKRAFSGIPKDYPNFFVEYGYLIIDFPENNPYFKEGERFYIDLYKQISPYGQELPYVLIKNMKLVALTDKASIFIPTLTFKVDKINEKINSWTNEIILNNEVIEQLTYLVKKTGEPYKLEPNAYSRKSYFSLTYKLTDTYQINEPLIATIAFNADTGETVNLLDLIPDDFNWSNAKFYNELNVEDDYDFYEANYLPLLNYKLDKESKFTAAWFDYDRLCVEITEPDGDKIIATIDFSYLKG